MRELDCGASTGARLAAALTLPIPAVLDSGAAVLLHLLLEESPGRPVILDASGLREVTPVGALLLAATLRGHGRRGPEPRIINLSHGLRLGLGRHPLIEFADAADPTPRCSPGRVFLNSHG